MHKYLTDTRNNTTLAIKARVSSASYDSATKSVRKYVKACVASSRLCYTYTTYL